MLTRAGRTRILTDGKQEAAPPSDPYGFSEPPRTVELSSGSKGIVSRSGVKVIPNDAKKAPAPMAIVTERPSTPPADFQELIQTARAISATGKGILAADESTGTIGKRFAYNRRVHP